MAKTDQKRTVKGLTIGGGDYDRRGNAFTDGDAAYTRHSNSTFVKRPGAHFQ
jgi:hypothetical protein